MEVWKPIPSSPGYEASSLGRVRSVDRVVEHVGRWGTTRRSRYVGRLMRLQMRSSGYLFFSTGRGGPILVSRAVCAAFHGPPPTDQHEAAHLDGDFLRNTPDNLQWCTPKENAAHKKLHGTHLEGEAVAVSKIKEQQVPSIFSRYISGEASRDIAASLGVSSRTIRHVLIRHTWAHVQVPPEDVAEVARQAPLRKLAAMVPRRSRRQVAQG